jgi:imidazoleglycerol phosphate synthase glutamine amidotransferase subunit HisH
MVKVARFFKGLAVRFYPEKSGTPGLTVLRNFCLWNGEEDEENAVL